MKNPKLIALEVVLVVIAAIGATLYYRHIQPQLASPPAVVGENIDVVLRHVEPTLTEIDLVNHGPRDSAFQGDILITWSDTELANADALADFEHRDSGRRSVTFHPTATLSLHPLKPQERRAIGWVKLVEDAPLHAEVSSADNSSPTK